MSELVAFTADAERRAQAASVRLAAAAAEQDLVDVALGDMDSPIGPLTLAMTEEGLLRVVFASEDRDATLDRVAREVSPRILDAPARTDEARRQLDAYFAGALRRFDLALDRRLMSRFVRSVLDRTEQVGFGEVATYGQVAKDLGRPTAARAVGAALGTNPIPIVVPCHRIVGANGRLTGYAGGLERKEFLLRLEGSLAV